MKTFSEACESTYLSIVPFEGVIDEIQNSFEAEAFAHVLLQMGEDQHLPPMALLQIAFSHGVMVGIEMEKQPYPVESTEPTGAGMPPEANP